MPSRADGIAGERAPGRDDGRSDGWLDYAGALTDCVTMGIGPAEARELSYWEYSALLQTWNARHDPDGASEPVEPPADRFVRERQARLAEQGVAGSRRAAPS